jgi:hypothetical protein
MCVAQPARHRSAGHVERVVVAFVHILLCDGLPEAGPASAGLEFGFRTEQRCAAADASVDTFVMVIPILTGKGAFSSCIAGYFKGRLR